ncbi:hypothetical protein ACQ4PT_040241 [Festuca glaucescens]
MGISSTVQWWEEWQLRILVLASLALQYILFVTSLLRKIPMKPGVKLILWLAYLGGDAIAIYALATLFNRQKNQDGSHARVLEVFWAPILLIHLGGRDSISAFNIEDNELWTRQLLVMVSQVTVAIYVFWRSWPGINDKRLLQAAIILFVIGVLRCFEKPWTLNSASINSMASSPRAIRRMIHAPADAKIKPHPLQDFVEKVKMKTTDGASVGLSIPDTKVDFTPYKLFVDLASPSTTSRIKTLRSFSALDENDAYDLLQKWLSDAFHVFYTKENTYPGHLVRDRLRYTVVILLLASTVLFHFSRREAYIDKDVKVTYALLCCTLFLEALSFFFGIMRGTEGTEEKDIRLTFTRTVDGKVSQYNLIGFFVRHKKHYILMSILGLLKCRDFFHQRWCMKPSPSSRRITKLVLQHVKHGWEDHIKDASCYREFNDRRGLLTLGSEGCYDKLAWTIEGPFDESVLLWHLATDFCYYRRAASAHTDHCKPELCFHLLQFSMQQCCHPCDASCHHKRASQCRDMSNYMVYLLYVNPEMLMAGTRRHLFTSAYKGLESIIKEGGTLLEESKIVEMIITTVEREGSPPDGSEQGIIHDAWAISKLLEMPADKMWKVIEGVWVEMICFSASRCRGYLHAKALGMGTEYLTYVWLLLYHMGMESIAERLQRVDLPKEEVRGADGSSSDVSRAARGKEEDNNATGHEIV